MSRLPRVVLDTNLVLSALVFAHGRLAPLRQAWQQARCRPLVSGTTAAELVRVLAYPKFRLTPDDQRELLADYLPYCTAVRIPAKRPKTPDCRDPFDVPFLELTIAGKADFLVTGDKDLLALAGKLPCPVVTGDRLLEALG
jgi:putative PIN family toxin of toxin-antitoxin system